MNRIFSFPPIADSNANTLILGSMPGRESLRAGQYYAHPRNAFWPIMGDLIGASPALPYETRIGVLRSFGIAVWDVLASCTRDGSLDADIDEASIATNNFTAFFSTHRDINAVFFNGAMAEKCFRRRVLPYLDPHRFSCQRLPSTSPANASFSYAMKRSAWQVIPFSEKIAEK